MAPDGFASNTSASYLDQNDEAPLIEAVGRHSAPTSIEEAEAKRGLGACVDLIKAAYSPTSCLVLSAVENQTLRPVGGFGDTSDALIELAEDLRLSAHETGAHGDVVAVQRLSSGIAWAAVRRSSDAVVALGLVFNDEAAIGDEASETLRSVLALLSTAAAGRRPQPTAEHDADRFESLTNSIPGVVYQRLVTSEGEIRYTYISESAFDLFGVPASEILSNPKALFSAYTPEYRESFRRRLIEASKAMTTWDVEASIIMPDGTRKFTHAIATPRKLSDGSVLWTGVILDASRIKEAERRAAQAEAQTRTSIVESLGVGFLMFDRDDRLTVANSHYHAMQPIETPALRPGVAYADVIRNETTAADQTDFDEAMAARRVRERLRLHHAGRSFSLESCPSEDVWLQINEHRLADGGTVVIYTDITEIRRREERINHMALHDALTGLPNRKYLSQRLEEAFAEARRNKALVAVFCLDLDNFKTVNDTLGHPIGDRLLCEAVTRIKRALRGMDTVARLGGDEFAVVLPNIATVGQACAVADRIISEISRSFSFDGQSASVGASIGIAIVGEEAGDPTLALKHADLALYSAKADGKNCMRLFEKSMDEDAQARRMLELELRRAVDKGEFELHFQPQINSADKAVSGFEALLRWRHPTRGLVSPGAFIPLAEETGLIVRIGDWVLETACRTAVNWPEDFQIAVNVSPIQFKRPTLVARVKEILEETGLAPERLELEITESVLLSDTDENVKKLFDLRETGVRIAMDDFGTGYSSLGNLRSFPFDKIKIDRSFVSDITNNPEADAIVRAIASLGMSLGVETTAEGVETVEQLSQVVSEGCTQIQGFFYGEPMPSSEVSGYLKKCQE